MLVLRSTQPGSAQHERLSPVRFRRGEDGVGVDAGERLCNDAVNKTGRMGEQDRRTELRASSNVYRCCDAGRPSSWKASWIARLRLRGTRRSVAERTRRDTLDARFDGDVFCAPLGHTLRVQVGDVDIRPVPVRVDLERRLVCVRLFVGRSISWTHLSWLQCIFANVMSSPETLIRQSEHVQQAHDDEQGSDERSEGDNSRHYFVSSYEGALNGSSFVSRSTRAASSPQQCLETGRHACCREEEDGQMRIWSCDLGLDGSSVRRRRKDGLELLLWPV